MSKDGRQRRCVLLFGGGRRGKRSEKSANKAESDRNQCEHVNDAGGNVVHTEQSDTVVVLRVKLHCPACVTEVTRSLQQVEGVKEVSADAKAEMVTVKGYQLAGERLCHSVHKKTGKRCQVLLVTSYMAQSEEPMTAYAVQPQSEEVGVGAGGASAEPITTTTDIIPALPPHQPPSCSCTSSIMISAPPAPAMSHDQQQHLQLLPSSSSTRAAVLHDASEPRMEIRQQTHAVIYGWPSNYNAAFPPNYLLETPPPYPHNSTAYQLGFLSDENPNACHLM